MPPIPAKLAKRIQDGQFVEMVELLPDLLRGYNPSDEDKLKSSKSKYHESQITNIINWMQCFSLYIAIICHSQPQRTVDLLGYQNLIITSHQQFPAAASAVSDRSVLDNTLWNLARQSTTHPSKTQFTTYPSRSQYIEQSSRSQFSSSPSQLRKARVCWVGMRAQLPAVLIPYVAMSTFATAALIFSAFQTSITRPFIAKTELNQRQEDKSLPSIRTASEQHIC